MAYIGREPTVGNFQVCDAISVVNGQAAYTMQVSSVNVSPETANHMLVSLNGVLQAPGSSYTVSGSTITFASNLVTGDVINFIHILGSVLDLGVPSDDTVTLAKLASGTDGNLISYDTSGNPVAVATGNSGQILTSAGAGAIPTFADAAGGGAFNLLSTTTVSSAVAQVNITANIDSTYKNYMWILTDIKSASNDVRLRVQAFSSGGSPDTGSHYMYAGSGHRSDNGSLDMNSNGSGHAEITLAPSSDEAHRHNQFVMYMYNPSGAVSYKQFHVTNQQTLGDNKLGVGEVGFTYKKTIAVTGLRFFFSSGNITSGVWKLYGIN